MDGPSPSTQSGVEAYDNMRSFASRQCVSLALDPVYGERTVKHAFVPLPEIANRRSCIQRVALCETPLRAIFQGPCVPVTPTLSVEYLARYAHGRNVTLDLLRHTPHTLYPRSYFPVASSYHAHHPASVAPISRHSCRYQRHRGDCSPCQPL
ncbi:hypothetical protein PHLGIDRAFT_198496 [Phlebiopsis gigantea 11061_1 CR5-6]|uniref:Uncharacterized protein n=1 Tax=Phlebiopsis gigantea (strain 11061_1 CR5-6) TaxID=745531 RepID=A0A0C3NZG2_PHLG1|nr:hypothetical protein PHLGIDRAFT_198496 [Phlebiopsis gigantea 11061_1 CR5-6]